MAEVRWTVQAADDLEAIVEFISRDSEHYARLLAVDILEAVKRLETLPELGRPVPEITTPDIREILCGDYRVIYRVRADLVEILTVYHGARLLDPTRLD